MQEIADSLDLGLEVEEGKMAAAGRRKKGATGHALDREPNKVVGLGDVRLERRRESVGMGDVSLARRRESAPVEAGGSAGHALECEQNRVVSDGDWRLERRRRENVAMGLPVGKRRSVG